jgi:hypothetical protein
MKRSAIRARDLELLSAYLDGELSARQADRLRRRLLVDPAMRRELESLRATRELLRGLPPVRAPRNFTLSPEMVRRPLLARLFPALGLATAVATVALAVVIAVDLLGSFGLAAAPAMLGVEEVEATVEVARMMQQEAEEGAGPEAMPLAQEQDKAAAGALAPEAGEGTTAPPPMATPAPDGAGGALPEATQTAAPTLEALAPPMPTEAPQVALEEPAAVTPADAAAARERALQPSLPWVRWLEIGLAALALLLGALAFIARRQT